MRSVFATALVGMTALLGCPKPVDPPAPPSPAPRVVAFSVTPDRVAPGTSVTLTWTVEDAQKVELTQAGRGVISTEGNSTSVVVEQDALFVLTATNDRGVRDSATAWVEVDDGASNVLFVASPQKVVAGETVVLAWSAPGARSVSLATAAGQSIDLGGRVQNGSIEVQPQTDTVYALTVDGETYEAGVYVAPSVDLFESLPASARPGEAVVLSWRTTGASQVSLSVNGAETLVTETDAAKVAEGSFSFTVPTTVDPAAVFTFELSARGGVSEVVTREAVQVYVTGAPKVREWIVPTYARTGSTFEVHWTTTGADHVQIVQDGTVVYDAPTLADVDSGTAEFTTPAADTTLQLRAFNSRGGEDLSELAVVNPVGAPTVDLFEATPQPGIANGGDAVTLNWSVPNARNVVITANGQRTVHTQTGIPAESGTLTVYPNEDTVYELVADNALGETAPPAQSTVTVAAPAQLVFSPEYVPAGATTQLTGTTLAGAGTMQALNFVQKNPANRSFIDISGTGTSLNFVSGDDTVGKLINLPERFEMDWNGQIVGGDKISVSVNGWMMFSQSAIGGDSVPDTSFPSSDYEPFAMVAFGRDLQMSSTSQVYWTVDGTGAQQRVIVQWNDVQFYGSSNASKRLTFQIQLHATGEVVFAYNSIQGLSTSDAGAIGLVHANDSTAYAPLSAQLTNSKPVSGDVFSFYGELQLPANITASSTPLQVRAEIGTGQISITDGPVIVPANGVLLTEAMANPGTGAADAEWIELENVTTQDIDLAGWQLTDGTGNTHTISGALVLPAGARAVLGQTLTAAGSATVDYEWGSGFVLPKDGTALSLTSGGIALSQLATGEGTPIPGRSVQRGGVEAGLTVASGTTSLVCGAPLSASYGTGLYGTPGAANPPCLGYLAPASITGAFEPLATTGGTLLAPAGGINEGLATVPLTLPVTFAGLSFDTLYVNTNGFLTLQAFTCTSSTNCFYSNPSTVGSTSRPTPGAIAPFWDDLTANTGGGIYVARRDPGVTPNDGYTVVSWENVALSGATYDLNFQVKFFDTGDVEFHYGTMSGTGTTSAPNNAKGASATTWLESFTRGAAYTVNINSATTPGITPASGIRFAAQ